MKPKMDKPIYGVNHGPDPATSMLRVKKSDGSTVETVFAAHQSDEVDEQAKKAMLQTLENTEGILEVTLVLSEYWDGKTTN